MTFTTSHDNELDAASFSRRRALLTMLKCSAFCVGMNTAARSAEAAPLRIVVATAPGGVPDAMARTIGQQITQDTGRVVLVDNKVGAVGALAAATVQNAPADGAAIVLVESGSYAIAPHLNKINPFAALTPVGLAATAPIFLCVNSQIGVASFEQFVAYLKKNPGTPYGSSGIGSSHHLAMEFLRSDLKVDVTHVPYKGAGQAVVAVVGGEVKTAFLGYSTAAPQAANGRLRILGIASVERNVALAPEIATVAEVGGPRMNFPISLGLFANSNTPARELTAINRQFGSATASSNVRNRLAQLGIESSDGSMTPAQFAALTKREFAFYGDLVRSVNLKAE